MTLLLQWIPDSICCVTIPAFTMSPKKSHKSVRMRKLDAQLDHFLQTHARGTQAGSSSTGVSAHPPSCPLKKPVGLHARSTEVVPSTAPSASYSGSEPRFLAQSGAHSVPSSPLPCDTGGLYDLDPLSIGAFEASEAQAGGSAPGAPSQELIQPEPLECHDSEDNLASLIPLPDLQTTHRFLELLLVAVLEGSGMHDEDIKSIREPGPEHELLDPSPLVRSIRHFVNNSLSSREHYETFRRIELLHNPDNPLLSFDQVKRRVRWLSGVVPLEHDMCTNSCVAYTGPYSELEACPRCAEPRYIRGTTKPQKQFSTIPIGPVIQAFYGSREVAEHMHYLEKKLAENLGIAAATGGNLAVYDDTACGQELLDAWRDGCFQKIDIALQFSIDGPSFA